MILSFTERILQCWGKWEFGENFQVDWESVSQQVLIFLPLFPAQRHLVSPAMETRSVLEFSLITGKFPDCIHAQSQLPRPVFSFFSLIATISYSIFPFLKVSSKEVSLLLFYWGFMGGVKLDIAARLLLPCLLHAEIPHWGKLGHREGSWECRLQSKAGSSSLPDPWPWCELGK